jgi:hypothetical protein
MLGRQLANAGSRLPRSTIVVVACLLLGIAVGALVSSFAIARKAAKVSDADYVLMVADLFDHEKSVFNARERLAVIGKNPVDIADAALETYSREHPEDRRGVDSLRQLDQGLRQAEADAASTRGASSPGIIGVLALIVASVVIAAGAAWIWRLVETRGVRLPSVPSRSERGAPGRGLATAVASAAGALRRRPTTRSAPDEELTDDEPSTSPARPHRRPLNHRRPSLASIEAPPPIDGRRTPRPVSAGARMGRAIDSPEVRDTAERRTFAANYRLGDDPYDDVHPIVDDRGELIGACGLSATESSDRAGRYYGFTCWLQDYVQPNELSAVGLVTRSGQIARSAAIAEWRRRGTIDEVHAVERGLQIGLRTSRIDAVVTIVDFDYTPPAHGSPGYFARLNVRLEVGPAY